MRLSPVSPGHGDNGSCPTAMLSTESPRPWRTGALMCIVGASTMPASFWLELEGGGSGLMHLAGSVAPGPADEPAPADEVDVKPGFWSSLLPPTAERWFHHNGYAMPATAPTRSRIPTPMRTNRIWPPSL